MLGSVPLTAKAIEDYRPIIGDEAVEEILSLASGLKGAKVLHINATAFGGGVAELLSAMVPLMCDLGLDASWQVITGNDPFFNVTKAMHNSLQGMITQWTPEMWNIWSEVNRENASRFDEDYDFVVVHDPQPAGLRQMVEDSRGRVAGKWLWRCHIDLTEAQVEVWEFVRSYVQNYDVAIFTMREYVKEGLHGPKVHIVAPAIDPLSLKNVDIPLATVHEVLARYGVDPARPMITQVSRFDPWKDPLGVIDAYRIAKKHFPTLQLVMVGSMANDDPEGWAYYERTLRRAGEDFDIFILSNLNGVGNVEVNAFQSAAQVVIQKSLREGFGLTVTEGLWKGRPVVAGAVGGILLQVQDGVNGYLVQSVQECADRLVHLLEQPALAQSMGEAGREHVRKNFLITRNLRDYLRIFNQLSGYQPSQ